MGLSISKESQRNTTYDGENSIITGVTSPIKTDEDIRRVDAGQVLEDVQLLNQFDAVASETPLLRTDCGKTSLGRIHPMGP